VLRIAAFAPGKVFAMENLIVPVIYLTDYGKEEKNFIFQKGVLEDRGQSGSSPSCLITSSGS